MYIIYWDTLCLPPLAQLEVQGDYDECHIVHKGISSSTGIHRITVACVSGICHGPWCSKMKKTLKFIQTNGEHRRVSAGFHLGTGVK